MQLVNIQTLAFTPPHVLPWRVFLYTHTQHTPDAGGSGEGGGTLVLGELLYAGEANGKDASEKQEVVKDESEATGYGDEQVKVTLRQQPRDAEALRAFLSVLTSVLHALSSEKT